MVKLLLSLLLMLYVVMALVVVLVLMGRPGTGRTLREDKAMIGCQM